MKRREIGLLDMFHHAEAMGLDVEYDDLGPRHGEIRDGGTVYLNPNDPETLQRVTLAHECGHHWHRHQPARTAVELGRQERAADAYAAVLLISRVDYERAERLYGHNPWMLARELGVTPRLIKARQHTFAAEAAMLASAGVS